MYYVILSLIILFLLVQLLWILHKKKFKGLNEIPGPKDYPIIGNIFDFGLDTKEQWHKILEICRTYKPFAKIWLGPNCIFISTDPAFTKHVLSSLKYLKKSIEYEVLRPYLKNGLILSSGKFWQKRRKMITPAFDLKVLKNYSIVFNSKVDCLIQELSRHVNKEEFDVCPYVTQCALDMICEIVMGITLEGEMKRKYVDYIHRSKQIIISRIFSPWKRFDTLFKLSPDYQVQKQIQKYAYEVTSVIIHERRKILQENKKNKINEEKNTVFLDILLNGTIDGKSLTHEEIDEELHNFMAAGHDTTASFISFAMYALSKEPDIQDKIYAEIKQIFGNDKNYQPTLHEINEMNYTERVLKEVHRLYPSVPYIARHIEEDIHYKDMVIPKDTTIVIPIYCMHRREDLFPNPEKFDPDRFLSKEHIDKYSYLPFSVGARNCIGQRLAMYEVKCAICKIIMNFKILPGDPKNEVQPAAEISLESKNGVHIKLINRENTQ